MKYSHHSFTIAESLCRHSVDELDFPQRLKDAVFELALVKSLFRLGPDADLDLPCQVCEVRDCVPCRVKLIAVRSEVESDRSLGASRQNRSRSNDSRPR